jgi:hypothetical protein
MRAHEGTLRPATLTDRSANGLLAELGAPERLCGARSWVGGHCMLGLQIDRPFA